MMIGKRIMKYNMTHLADQLTNAIIAISYKWELNKNQHGNTNTKGTRRSNPVS